MRRSGTPRTLLPLAPLLLLLAGAPSGAHTATLGRGTVIDGGSTLHDQWQPLVGKRGILEQGDCHYLFTVSLPTQSGNATVLSLGADHVVLEQRQDQDEWELVVPLERITLRSRR